MRQKTRPAFLIAFAFLYLSIGCHYLIDLWEDGAVNFAAYRVLTGDVPYRDFILLTTPGHFYVLAFLFKIFGASMIVERLWQCLAWALIFWLIYRIVREFSSEPASLLGWFLALVWTGRFFHVPGPMPSAMAFSLGGVYLWLLGISKGRSFLFFLSGVSLGISALFRQDIGVCMTIGILAGTALLEAGRLRKKDFFTRFPAGIFASVALPAAYFLSQAPWKDLFFDFVWFPLKVYPSYTNIPWPSTLHENTFIFHFSWIVPMIGVVASGLLWRKKFRDITFGCLMALSIGGTLLVGPARLRPDVPHLMPATMIACALFSFFIDRLWKNGRRATAAGLAAAVLLSCVPGLTLKSRILFSPPKFFYFDLPRARNIGMMPATREAFMALKNYEMTVQYLRERTRPGERIFVGSIRHDRVCYGDPLFYFLSLTGSATKYHELYRGIVVTESVQKEMVSELEREKVRYVVIRPFLDEQCGEPNASSVPSGSRVLDLYLRAHFAIEKEFGNEKVLVRVS